ETRGDSQSSSNDGAAGDHPLEPIPGFAIQREPIVGTPAMRSTAWPGGQHYGVQLQKIPLGALHAMDRRTTASYSLLRKEATGPGICRYREDYDTRRLRHA
ncbi:hypothetical protein ALP52_02931, partial [Pseudomonas amygdali pv. mori]